MIITLNIPDDQLPELARLIAAAPGLATRIAAEIRKRPDSYTKAEAAKAFGVSIKTISRRIEAGVIPTVKNIHPPRIPAAWVTQQLNPQPNA